MSLILAGSRPLRFFSFTVFYVAQGLPFGLVTVALPAYLAEQGVSAGVDRLVHRRRHRCLGASSCLPDLSWTAFLISRWAAADLG